MPKTPEAHDKLIREIFEGSYQFEISDYQCPYAWKKDVYFSAGGRASPFVLMQDVRQKNEWTPEVLEERQKRLLNVLKSHWNLDVATEGVES